MMPLFLAIEMEMPIRVKVAGRGSHGINGKRSHPSKSGIIWQGYSRTRGVMAQLGDAARKGP
jgi:hypothetical protein